MANPETTCLERFHEQLVKIITVVSCVGKIVQTVFQIYKTKRGEEQYKMLFFWVVPIGSYQDL